MARRPIYQSNETMLMSTLRVGLAIFFVTYSINYFFPFDAAGIILAVGAIIAAIGAVANK